MTSPPEIFKRWAEAGYLPDLLPIIPPGATLDPTSKIKPGELGKIPGKYLGGTWVGRRGWRENQATAEAIAYYDQLHLDTGCNVGLIGRQVIALDLDISNQELVEALVKLAHDTLGITPIRGRSNSPKALLMYRHPGLAAKIRREFTFKTSTGKFKEAIEVLGAGQYWNVAGTHPTGVPYDWRTPAGFGTTPPTLDSLPEVTADQIETYLQAAADVAEGFGYQLGGTDRPAPKQATSEPPRALHGDLTTDETAELIKRYLLAVDPTNGIGGKGGTGGHAMTNGLAACLADLEATTPELVEDGMMSHWAERCEPPWSQHEISSVVRSAFAHSTVNTKAWSDAAIAGLRRAAIPPNVGEVLQQAAAGSTGNIVNLATARAAKAKPKPVSTTGIIRQKKRTPGFHNIVVALRTFDDLKGRLRYNEFAEAAEVVGSLPWSATIPPRRWADHDSNQLRLYLFDFGVDAFPADIDAAVDLVSRDATTHPVRERLDSFVWDGVERLDFAATTYFHAPAETANAFFRMWMIGAVARIYEPGCKVDTMVVLEGEQGLGKSRLLRLLAMEDAWFSDQVATLGTKDASQDLRAKWIIELGELAAFRNRDVETLKGYISRQVDHYRASYARRSTDHPRQCVFVGTTNPGEYLRDATGGRRFWPIAIPDVDLGEKELLADREQLWAEAVYRYKANERWWIDRVQDPELWEAAKQEAAARYQPGPLFATVEKYVAGGAQWNPQDPPEPPRDEVTLEEICFAAGISAAHRTRTHDMDITDALKHLGFRRVQIRVGTSRQWVYRRAKVDPPTCP